MKMRMTTVSPVTPWPPKIWTQRSTTRHSASEQGHLRTARFKIAAFALIEQPRRMPDVQARGLEIDVVVGEHETDALVLAERFAECLPPPRVIGRDVMRPPRLAEPAHAMRQSCRDQPHLRIAKPLADFAENIRRRNAQVLELYHRMAAGKAAVHRIIWR